MKNRTPKQRGNIFLFLFGALAMVGLLGAACLHILRGPVKTMSHVTKRTIAENSMMASGRLALVMSAKDPGDCDADGLIEPVPWQEAGSAPAPANGGHLPSTIGASLLDPWGNAYGYCAWDHGGQQHAGDCAVTPHRLAGHASYGYPVIAITSSGPDRKFQTGCLPHGQASYVLQTPGSDDIILSYTYAEAASMSAGLWNLKEDDAGTATISKNLSVTDSSGSEQFTFDAQQKELVLGEGGTGALPNIRTDYIQNLTANAPVEFLSDIKATAIETGGSGVGLKAAGTSKAIESNGILDMTEHKIVNVATPLTDTDAATKKYVDDTLGSSVPRTRCEAFVFSGCSGGTTQNLNKSSLGECKKACEGAGVSCCSAQYATTASNPNTALSQCVGHTGGKPTGSLVNLLAGLLFPAYIGAYCFVQY